MTGTDLLFRAFLLEPTSERADLISRIERVLGFLNQNLGLTFEHDGAETTDDVTSTVWTDDASGDTQTSWIRLIDDEGAGSLCLEINATNSDILDEASTLFSSHTPVVQRVDRAQRPFG